MLRKVLIWAVGVTLCLLMPAIPTMAGERGGYHPHSNDCAPHGHGRNVTRSRVHSSGFGFGGFGGGFGYYSESDGSYFSSLNPQLYDYRNYIYAPRSRGYGCGCPQTYHYPTCQSVPVVYRERPVYRSSTPKKIKVGVKVEVEVDDEDDYRYSGTRSRYDPEVYDYRYPTGDNDRRYRDDDYRPYRRRDD